MTDTERASLLANVRLEFLAEVLDALLPEPGVDEGLLDLRPELLDEIVGFKDYLEVAEKYEMELRNPPEKTPELFEKYLPHALALGVDQSWAEKFAAILSSAQQTDGKPYSPSWYNGSWDNVNLGHATSNLTTSLNTAVTHSVTPPGSSSGGGGGGFSGGGGGGGGGGGW